MWSFGASLYQMAVAYLPTAIKSYKYGTGPIPYRGADWVDYDLNQLKDLINSCLQINPNKRITAEEALNHPWLDL
jgi:serine/threonine protein kinase